MFYRGRILHVKTCYDYHSVGGKKLFRDKHKKINVHIRYLLYFSRKIIPCVDQFITPPPSFSVTLFVDILKLNRIITGQIKIGLIMSCVHILKIQGWSTRSQISPSY